MDVPGAPVNVQRHHKTQSSKHKDRRRTGLLAETLAARFLESRGHRVLVRNVPVGRGEVDILAQIDGERTVVEVRSRWTRGRAGFVDPLHSFDEAKVNQVRRLAASPLVRAGRVDLIAVGFGDRGVELLWLPRVA